MIAVELDTDAREASGLLAAGGSTEAYWSVLDEHRVEDSIVLVRALRHGERGLAARAHDGPVPRAGCAHA